MSALSRGVVAGRAPAAHPATHPAMGQAWPRYLAGVRPGRPELVSRGAGSALLLSAALAMTACSPDDPRRDQAEKALQKADEVIAEGREFADPYVDKASGSARAWARSWMPELPTTGDLSEQASRWIEDAAADDARAEYWLDKGKQSLPVAREIGRTVNEAIERDFVVEPVYRPLDDELDLVAVDASIASMPRVEVIDGLTVGFRKLAADDMEGRETQAAFLVLWRAERNLVGFIFRSRRKIRLDKLVAETPRLVELVRGVTP